MPDCYPQLNRAGTSIDTGVWQRFATTESRFEASIIIADPRLPAMHPLLPEASMKQFGLILSLSVLAASTVFTQDKKGKTLNVNPPAIATDASVKYDYDIVYVVALRKGNDN